MKIILFNGPPGSGKDYAGKVMLSLCAEAQTAKFARILKERTHGLYGLYASGRPLPYNWFEDRKDEPAAEFLGLTPRQAYIAVSEDYLKPKHGKAVLGDLLLQELRNMDVPFVAVTDSGFVEEAEKVVDHFGAAHCRLVRLHRDGCSFHNDSRGYIDLSHMGVMPIEVVNNGTSGFIEDLILQLHDVLPKQQPTRLPRYL